MANDRRLDEEVISQAAQAQLTNQIDAAEAVNVDVHTDLLKAVQGKADSISVEGRGVVVQKEIRMQEIELHTDGVAVDPLSALLGQIKLSHPVNSFVRVVLTEADINRTVNSDFVRERLKPLELNVEGEIVPIDLLLPLEMRFPKADTIDINGNACIHEKSGDRRVHFSVTMHPRTESQPVMMEKFYCGDGNGLAIDLTVALLRKIQELVNAPYIEVEDLAFRIKSLKVEPGIVSVETEAHIRQVPSL
jgi:hypothetical protein